MRNLKRALSLALAAVMLIGMMVVGTGAANVSDFPDGDQIDHTEAASVISGLGIMVGDANGFRPNDTITRAEMAVIIDKMLYGSNVNASIYGDLDIFDDCNGHWAKAAINLAYTAGVVAGVGDGKFDPDATLTVAEATTMVVKALKISCPGDVWPLNVMAKASELGLFQDMNITANQDMSRDNIAVLTFQGLLYSPSGERTYTVTIGSNVYTFDNAFDAYFYNQANGGTLGISTAKDSLGAKVFGLTINENDTDAFGRTVTTYASTKNEYKDLNVVIGTSAATYTYTSATAADKLGLARGTTYADGLKATVDGKKEASGVIADAADLAGLTADNAVVEVYTSGNEITKIVKITTYATTVATVVRATNDEDRKITLTGGSDLNTIYTEDFAKDDVVLYTKALASEDPDKYDVVDIKLADSVTGTLTRYSSDNKFTINGSVYTLAGAGVMGGLDVTGIQGTLGSEKVFYLNNNGQIIHVTDYTGGVVATGSYAYILNSNVTVSGNWLNKGEIKGEVQAVLSDGTINVYELAVKQTAGAAGTANADKTKYTVSINGTDQRITEDEWIDNNTAPDALQTLLNNTTYGIGSVVNGNVYEYSLNSSRITLRTVNAYTGSEAVDDVADMTLKTGTSIDAGTLVGKDESQDDDFIMNNNTVFVLMDGTKTPTLVTGAANLGGTTIAATDVKGIIVRMASAGEGNPPVAVANVVFAAKKFESGSNVDVNDYIYVTGVYSTVKDGNKTVYAYQAFKSDGSEIEVTGSAADKPAGLYTYDSVKMALDGDKKADVTTNDVPNLVSSVSVTYITGDTVIVNGRGITVNSDTNVVIVDEGGRLEIGSTIAYVTDSKGVASVVFVIPTPHVHTYGAWSTSGTTHSRTCSDCGDVDSHTATLDGAVAGDLTHTESGGEHTHSGTCKATGCNQTVSESCTAGSWDATSGTKKCTKCEATMETCTHSEKSWEHHKGATCVQTCNECGYQTSTYDDSTSDNCDGTDH